MISRPPQLTKQRVADLLKIVQPPPLREVFHDLMESMRNLPLPRHDLADFLRLVGYDDICGKVVSDEDLPFIVAQLERFLSKSTDELLEILSMLQAREWHPVARLPLGQVLETVEPHSKSSACPVFRVPSFHDPPGFKAKQSFDDQWRRFDFAAFDALPVG
jgi:hypothetical protein